MSGVTKKISARADTKCVHSSKNMTRAGWGCVFLAIIVIVLIFFSLFAWFMYLVEYVDFAGYSAGICKVLYIFVQKDICFEGVAMFHIDLSDKLR